MFGGAVFIMEILRTKNCIIGFFGACLGLLAGVVVGALLSPFAALIYIVTILYSIFLGLKFMCLTLAMKISACWGGRIERPEETIAKDRALRMIQEKIAENRRLID